MNLKTAICVLIKDEHDYLDEWLEHHFNLGIDEIFLYEDYGSKSHLDIVKQYGNKVHLNSIDIILKNKYVGHKQDVLFNYFLKQYKGKIDWVLFNDIDEFLILKQPLQDLLEEYNDKSGILLSWVWFGANGYIKKPIGKVMDNFTCYVNSTFDYEYRLKSFVNLNKYKCWDLHIHKIKGGIFPLNEFGIHKAWINHYFTKSWEEWKIKILERGDACPGNRKIEDFFILNKDMLPLKEQLMSEVTEIYKDEKIKK